MKTLNLILDWLFIPAIVAIVAFGLVAFTIVCVHANDHADKSRERVKIACINRGNQWISGNCYTSDLVKVSP